MIARSVELPAAVASLLVRSGTSVAGRMRLRGRRPDREWPPRGRRSAGVVTALFVAATLVSPMPAPVHAQSASESDLRIGVLAVADTIASIGKLPELAQPLPFTRTSLADILRLDDVVTSALIDVLDEPATAGKLKEALGLVPGFTVHAESDDPIIFDYTRTEQVGLPLAFDDGSLRLGRPPVAGELTVTLASTTPFRIQLDETQPDPLLRFAVIGETTLQLNATATIDLAGSTEILAQQGFTDLAVTGGHYRIDYERTITLRDPDGRGRLALEDLRYTTPTDLFRVDVPEEPVPAVDELDILLDVGLPGDLGSAAGAAGTGTIALAGDGNPTMGWPDPTARDEVYGGALGKLTGLTVAGGIAGFAEYTGAALALQNAADVRFPNLDGSVADVFAPADALMEVLSSAAVAQIRCGLTETNPPQGVAVPDETVYCDAVTATGLPPDAVISEVEWFIDQPVDGSEPDTIETTLEDQQPTVGPSPSATIKVEHSDGRPDVGVTFKVATKDANNQDVVTSYTARTMPRTIQEITQRIDELGDIDPRLTGSATAAVDLADDRLEVHVAIQGTPDASASLAVGDPGTLGALVGLTGLGAATAGAEPATATVSATGASFDVGFGIPFDPDGEDPADPADDHAVVLLPLDSSLISVEDLAIADLDADTLSGLSAQIGFLGVTADVTALDLGVATRVTPLDPDAAGPAVGLVRTETGEAIDINELIVDGALEPTTVTLVSNLAATIAIEATELPVATTGGGDTYVVGGQDGPTSGIARVIWHPGGALPELSSDDGYQALRVFDPVSALLVQGSALVVAGTGDEPDTVKVVVESPEDLLTAFDLASAPPSPEGTELARRVLGTRVSCQSVTILDAHTLTCKGLAPNGTAAFSTGDTIDLIVLGDPWFMRDSIIEGLARTLNELDWLTDDNLDAEAGHPDNDQLMTTLPMVDLLPRELAPERPALAEALGRMVAAAAADETSASASTVSSAQHLADFVRASGFLYPLVEPAPDATAGIAYDLVAGGDLGVTLTAHELRTVQATLRFMAPYPEPTDPTATSPLAGQALGPARPVGVDSTTVVDLDIDTATSIATMASGTGTSSTATMDWTSGVPFGPSLQVGTANVPLTGQARLDVTVDTALEAGKLVTRRLGEGARADLVVPQPPDEDPETPDALEIAYAWPAWYSSGGLGAAEDPAEDQATARPMELPLLAQGLPSLAGALEVALDGASHQNTTAEGPLSAPLIGTNLDAGAGVAAAVRALGTTVTSELRQMAAPSGDPTDEIAAALAGIPGLSVSSVGCFAKGAVVCVDATDTVTGDDPTTWQRITLSLTLSGTSDLEPTNPAALAFSVGLDGLAVRSTERIGTDAIWEVPVTLELVRGSGAKVSMGDLAVTISASMPTGTERAEAVFGPDADDVDAVEEACEGSDLCMPAILGYLPGVLRTASAGSDGQVRTVVTVTSDGELHRVFDVDEGRLGLTTAFSDPSNAPADDEQGLKLGFVTLASNFGSFDLLGDLVVPWTAETGFDDSPDMQVKYDQVKLDVGEIIAQLATPFEVADPYLGPARDVVDVLRSPVPVVSDLSELAGAGEISLLSLLEKLSTAGGDQNAKAKKLELAYRIISYVETAVGLGADVTAALGVLAQRQVPLDDLEGVGALLSIEPTELSRQSCQETVRSLSIEEDIGEGDQEEDEEEFPIRRNQPQTAECPDDPTSTGLQRLEIGLNRKAKPQLQAQFNTSVAQTVTSVHGSIPGFSLPFLNDPSQLIDVLTGTGEATYFRLDLGTLGASVSYTQKFTPIPIGPVPVQPFIGGSISIEGRLALGFDSMPQTLAVQSLDDPGDVGDLVAKLNGFGVGGILREAFYLDDYDSDGIDVPEIKLITSVNAGAGVTIGIISAGLKGEIVLSIALDLNDPNGDGRIRIAEMASWVNRPQCIFNVQAAIQAFLKFFFEIDLFFFSRSVDFYILRLGPYTIDYGCQAPGPANIVDLAAAGAPKGTLTLLSGAGRKIEVRQFDVGGGAGVTNGMTVFEVAASGLVQRVEVIAQGSGKATLKRYVVAEAVPTHVNQTVTDVSLSAIEFTAVVDNAANDWSFLAGDTYDAGALVTTRFTVPVEVNSGGGADVVKTGDAVDRVQGGPGDDTIETGAGDDFAWGEDEAGALSCGATCADTIRGGPGFDQLTGGPGNDKLQGGAGGDWLRGGDNDDFLLGGPGRSVDEPVVSASAEATPAEVVEDDPPDDVRADVERQVIDGFDTGDVLVGGDGADTVDGADGSDIVIGGDRTGAAPVFETVGRAVGVDYTYSERDATYHTMLGVDGLRTVALPSAADLDIQCDSGQGGAGGDATSADIVSGGPERDILVGGDGPDTLTGGAGPDEICGKGGDDLLVGDTAADSDSAIAEPTADGTGVGDVIRGGTGDDRINAGPGDDVLFGDDVDLVRDGVRVLDGSLGTFADGDGNDYLDGSLGDDILAGGDGADLVVVGAGHDVAAGEGRDVSSGTGTEPTVSDRLVDCRGMTRVVAGHVDLNGDLLASALVPEEQLADVEPDDGQLAGLTVRGGVVWGPDNHEFNGLIEGTAVIIDGLVDLDRDGVVGADAHAGATGTEDTGLIALSSMRLRSVDGSLTNPDGDCILGGNGEDALLGGPGADQAVGGDGKDFIDGGSGPDLLLGEGGNDTLMHGPDTNPQSTEGGTDVLLGGPDDDVMVGGDGFDYLAGGPGDDRLRGNNGSDDLIGGSRDAGVVDGQDVLLGGREEDVLVAENGRVASKWIIEEVEVARWHGGGFNLPEEVEALELLDPPKPPRDPSQSAAGCPPRDWPRWVTLMAGAVQDRSASTPSDPGHAWYDELYGGFDCDWVFGQAGDDLVRGGQGTDYVEGGPGSDTVMGDDDDDVLVGGSSVKVEAGDEDSGAIVFGRSGEGVPDGDDILIGDGGADHRPSADVLVGDNATATPANAVDSNWVAFADLYPSGPGVYGADVLIGDEPAGGIPVAGSIDTSDLYACEAASDTSAAGYPDWLFGQAGKDCLAGGPGPDYLEGNGGDDTLVGGPGGDDIIGGSSAADGRPMGTDGSRLWMPFTSVDEALHDTSAAGLADGDDTASGGDGDDIVLGDNGRIIRPWDESARQVAMADTACGASCGSDMLFGGDGDDILYGQLDDTTAYELPPGDPGNPLGRTQALATGDKLNGEAGRDVLIGDLGIVVPTPASEVGTERTLTPKGTAIAETVYESGATIPVTYTSAAMVAPGGADWALGGDGDDVIRLGAGDDIANGDDPLPNATGASLHTGDDVLFGSQGVDTLWGGTGHDHLFGGYGDDLLDVKPRAGDPITFFEVATVEDQDGPGTANGPDLEYGGWGADELQADFGSTGQPAESDYLVDWIGNHNVYYVCDGALGRGIVIRSMTTDLRSLVTELAKSAGATEVNTRDTGGWFELGLVRQGDQGDNTSPHPSAPGNFTCEATPAP